MVRVSKKIALKVLAVPLLAALLAITAASASALPFCWAAPENPSSTSPEVTINFVGDVLLAHGIGDLIQREGPMAPWWGVKDALLSADLTVGNLECAVGTTGEPLKGKEYTFRARPESLKGLVECGFDIVSLANNHTLDYGVDCMLETIKHLDDYGILHVGAGKDAASAWEGRIIEVKGIKIGFLATTMVIPWGWWRADTDKPGVAADFSTWNKAIVSEVKAMKARADVVVVLVHWGREHALEPEDWVLKLRQALLDAGADIIIGTHPHVLQGFSYDGKRFTAFSLGNFVFITNPKVPLCQTGGILRLTVTREGVKSAKLYPTTITWGRTSLLEDPSKKAELFSSLNALSQRFATQVDAEGNIWERRFSDLSGHWAVTYVMSLERRGIVNGTPDGTFRPNDPLTVEEWACLLASAERTKEELAQLVAPAGFSLVTQERWSYPYLVYMCLEGVFAPAEPGFNPAAPLTRAEVALMMWKKAGKPPAPPGVPDFADTVNLNSQERAAFLWARAQGLFAGYGDNRVGASDPFTRAQGAALLYKWLLLKERASGS
ncbi:MAG: CapA family protein [Firmicutes bacterium]|nr:CapA family protein [Candidatus Fermentithermobacillaceae bacterium]